MSMTTRYYPSHKTYDLVIDNDWEKRPQIVLFWSPSKVSVQDVMSFVNWCGKFRCGKLRVRLMPTACKVIIRRAS